jgi:hypothetical protein
MKFLATYLSRKAPEVKLFRVALSTVVAIYGNMQTVALATVMVIQDIPGPIPNPESLKLYVVNNFSYHVKIFQKKTFLSDISDLILCSKS